MSRTWAIRPPVSNASSSSAGDNGRSRTPGNNTAASASAWSAVSGEGVTSTDLPAPKRLAAITATGIGRSPTAKAFTCRGRMPSSNFATFGVTSANRFIADSIP